jgi:hypothetical protein
VSHGQTPPFTHDLLLLLERILPFHPEAEQLRQGLSVLIPYAVEIRYPDDWFLPSLADVHEAQAVVQQVEKWLQTSVPELFHSIPQEKTPEEHDSPQSPTTDLP